MKRIISLLLLFFLFTTIIYAQRTYSEANLRQASPEELIASLKKSQQLKKTGAAFSIAGPIIFGIGIIKAASEEPGSYSISDETGMIIMAGTISTFVGLPILITNSSRVKRITRIMNENSQTFFFELAPCSFQNCLSNNYQPGVTMRIRF